LTCLPVKKAGLAIANPTESAGGNYTASTVACGHLISALRGKEAFRSVTHQSIMAEAKVATRKSNLEITTAKLATILKKLPTGLSRSIARGQSTGAWLTVLPSIVNGTELSAEEFRDSLTIRYGELPSNFPQKCDGCDEPFSLQHALGCKKGGLIIFRHNEVRDELAHLATKAFTPSAVRNEPLICSGRVAEQVKVLAPKDDNQPNPTTKEAAPEDERGDLLIRGFWTRGTDCILDVRVTDTDAKSYRKRPPAKVIETQEKEKKRKYLENCLKQRRHFTPFVVSVDGLLGREAATFSKRLAAKLASKWQRSYSEVCGYVNARLSITIVRATHLCLRGSRVPTDKISTRRALWEDGAGLGLF
jgi:hypothetical protein